MTELAPPRDEIWFRKIYAELVVNRLVTTIFRPGKRVGEDLKGFYPGERLRVRIIDSVGAEWAGIYGRVCPDIEIPGQVREVRALRIADLRDSDFEGSTPDVFNSESLIYQLGIIYNFSRVELSNDAVITKTTFMYL